MNSVLSVLEVKTALITHLEIENAWNTEVKNRIVKVIHGYGKRDGLFDQLSGIVYRIWNAIKSLFGQSDWQQANKAISNQQNILEHPEVKALSALDLDGKLRKQIEKIKSETSNALLTAYVKATHFQVNSPVTLIATPNLS